MNLIQSGGPVIVNLVLTEANTEYSYALGPYVKKFLLQARGTDDLQLAFVAGESNSKFFTLKGSAVYFEDHIFGPITLYLQSASVGSIVEIVMYNAKD